MNRGRKSSITLVGKFNQSGSKSPRPSIKVTDDSVSRTSSGESSSHSQKEYEPSKRKLLIVWIDSPYVGRPISGVGKFGDKQESIDVYFKIKNENEYDLFTLTEGSKKLVVDEHNKFIEEVGYVRNYGATFSTEGGKPGNMTMYKIGYKFSDLETTLITTINFQCILNPVPHMVVDFS